MATVNKIHLNTVFTVDVFLRLTLYFASQLCLRMQLLSGRQGVKHCAVAFVRRSPWWKHSMGRADLIQLEQHKWKTSVVVIAVCQQLLLQFWSSVEIDFRVM